MKTDELENELTALGEKEDEDDDNVDDDEGERCEELLENEGKRKFQSEVQESIFGPGVKSFWLKKKKRKSRSGLTDGKKLPEGVAEPLNKAQIAYVSGEFDLAISLLSEVSKMAPKLPDSYHTMGLIHEESGNLMRAFQLYFIAAINSIRNADVWRKVAHLGFQLKQYELTLLALRRVIKLDSNYVDYSQKAIILLELHNLGGAVSTIKKMMKLFPNEIYFLVEFGEKCIARKFIYHGIHILTTYLFLISNKKTISPGLIREYKLQSMNFRYENDMIHIGDVFRVTKTVMNLLLHSKNDPRAALLANSIISACIEIVQSKNRFTSSIEAPESIIKLPLEITLLHCLLEIRSADSKRNIKAIRLLSYVTADFDKKLQSYYAKLQDELSSLAMVQDYSSNSTNICNQPLSRRQHGQISNPDGSQGNEFFNHITSYDAVVNGVLTSMRNELGSDSSLIFALQTRVRIAQEYADTGMFKEAYKALVQVITHGTILFEYVITPKINARCWYEIGRVFEKANCPNEAVKSLLKSSSYEANDPMTLFHLVRLCQHFNREFLSTAKDMILMHINTVCLYFDVCLGLSPGTSSTGDTSANGHGCDSIEPDFCRDSVADKLKEDMDMDMNISDSDSDSDSASGQEKSTDAYADLSGVGDMAVPEGADEFDGRGEWDPADELTVERGASADRGECKSIGVKLVLIIWLLTMIMNPFPLRLVCLRLIKRGYSTLSASR